MCLDNYNFVKHRDKRIEIRHDCKNATVQNLQVFFKVLNSIIPCSKRPSSPPLRGKKKEIQVYRALSVSA